MLGRGENSIFEVDHELQDLFPQVNVRSIIADIRDDARYAFKHAAPGGGFIMGSSHSLAVDARKENILEMKRCRDEWGVYPIDERNFV